MKTGLLAILGAVFLVGLLFALGWLNSADNLFLAVGIGMVLVGVAQLFISASPTGFFLIGGGLLVATYVPSVFPDLTAGSFAASFGVIP